MALLNKKLTWGSCLTHGIAISVLLSIAITLLINYFPYLIGCGLCFLAYRYIKSEKPKWVLITLVGLGTLFVGTVWTQALTETKNDSTQEPTNTESAKKTEKPKDNAEIAGASMETEKEETPVTFLVTRVIDGDTIEIEGGQHIRYIGIDTPETPDDCYSQEATNKNKELVEGKEVFLERDVSETNQYGRLLRYVYVDGTFVNDTLVSEGYAKASSYPPDIKYQERFLASETYARKNELGLWGPICNKPTCVYGTEVSRNCSECNYASVTKQNSDCSEFSKLEWDNSCNYLCPVEPAPVVSPSITPVTPTPSYNCNCSKTCTQMSSCDEAYYQLNTCGCGKRDGDNDGVPCENICPGG